MISKFIEFSIKDKTGIVKLKRPNALNALDYDMACSFLNILLEIEYRNFTTHRCFKIIQPDERSLADHEVKTCFWKYHSHTNKLFIIP